MKKCRCDSYEDILDYGILKKRFKETKSLLKNLEIISEHPGKEHFLYICNNCEHYWQRSLSWMDGNKQYFFKVPKIDIREWMSKPFVQPDELFTSTGMIRQYLDRATLEEQSTLCRHAECSHHTMRLSVFCIIHHMESIGIKSMPPENVTWFPPFEKEFIEPTYEKISELPKYKKYKQTQSQ